MTAPSDRFQVEFLSKLQRLLAEGQFVATYKFALLLALADIAIEAGSDTDEPLRVPVDAIADEFVRLYWRQAIPHPAGDVLHQNTGRPAAIVTKLAEVRRVHPTLAAARSDAKAWKTLVSSIARVVREMPLFKLQTLGSSTVEFLYVNKEVDGAVELLPGVSFCLRRFHGLIQDLVRGAWLRFVRRLPANMTLVGESADLSSFMFGTERDNLKTVGEALLEVDGDRCFYCEKTLKDGRGDVDHYIPWSMYPNDLGHNFVLAHGACNNDKSNTLAATVHLRRWVGRIEDRGTDLATAFDAREIVHDATASFRVMSWAYANAEASHAQLWLTADAYEPIDTNWRSVLAART